MVLWADQVYYSNSLLSLLAWFVVLLHGRTNFTAGSLQRFLRFSHAHATQRINLVVELLKEYGFVVLFGAGWTGESEALRFLILNSVGSYMTFFLVASGESSCCQS